MQAKLTIQLKAVFLLVVFSMNTLLGFACSIGLDLVYNRDHHTQQSAKPAAAEPAHCEAMAQDADDNTAPQHSHDCCENGVLKFNLSDKAVSSTVKLDAPVAAPLNIVELYLVQLLRFNDVPLNHYYVRSDHPPITADIRISIQSFQI